MTNYPQNTFFAILGAFFLVYITFVILDNFKTNKILDRDRSINLVLIIFIAAGLSGIYFIFPDAESKSYAGAIIGGLLTLLGVWWTINDQSKKRKEDIELMYKPILLLSDSDYKDADGYIQCDNNIPITYFYFSLKNLGRGEATNIIININCPNKNISLSYNKSINIICANEKMKFKIGVDSLYFTNFIRYIKIAEPIRFNVNVKYQNFNHKKCELNTEISLISENSDNTTFKSEISIPTYI